MFKILRISTGIFRFYEPKQYNFSASLKELNRFSTIPNIKLWFRSCSTKEHKGDTIINELIASDPDSEHKLKVFQLEIEVMRQEGRNVPSESFMKKDHWLELLKLNSVTGRKKYLTYLFKLEKKKENDVMRKEHKRKERDDNRQHIEKTGHLVYSLTNNNILLRIYDTTINQIYNYKLIQAMMFGQKLVVDCGYETEMNRIENVNCAKQLMLLFAENRQHDDPYDLHFCNFKRDGAVAKPLHKHIQTMYEPWFPLNLHEKSYADVFPKEKLIYLTPHCKEEMLDYDHDAIYIIGGIVDKAKSDPLSLAKAKREGLKMQKLPLDRYLQWGAGSGKNLTLNQMISILLDIKKTGDWNYALRHVPKRKIFNEKYSGINNSKKLSYDTDEKRHFRTRRNSTSGFRKKNREHIPSFNVNSIMSK